MLFAIPKSLRPGLLALSLLPIVVPTAYLLAIKAIASRHVAVSSTERVDRHSLTKATACSKSQPPPPKSLPAKVLEDDTSCVVIRERIVSHPVPRAALTDVASPESGSTGQSSELLKAYLRATMESFSWTPQAFAIRAMIKNPSVRRTFDTDYIHDLDFNQGDLVNGAFEVSYRGSPSGSGPRERVELNLVPLKDQPTLVVHSLVVTELEWTPSDVIFVNETWMWRDEKLEPLTTLERAVGRWLHALMVGWLIVRGTWAVTTPNRPVA